MKQETMKHKLFECACSELNCQFCAGGLGLCTVCGGFEGTLTTDCCGQKLTSKEEAQIYEHGVLDFKDGEWIRARNETSNRRIKNVSRL
ncbi:hypothetical protein LCGC14_0425410 [marine sediment metagenome]|uniref:Uncharacterized protein n=1 Tax=marine sediment metagenome TaxID=412755 RepID=A0A0F9SVN8_9ZZZZ